MSVRYGTSSAVLKKCRLRLMTSGGNLVGPEAFRGRDSILSGPAGGVVALGHVAQTTGIEQAIGLDMGGTSTDVSRFTGRVGRRYESRVAGVRVMTPMMDIETIAAGGGSICDVDSKWPDDCRPRQRRSRSRSSLLRPRRSADRHGRQPLARTTSRSTDFPFRYISKHARDQLAKVRDQASG